jgi:hypothetical protein
MSLRPFNSVSGISVGSDYEVIDANGNVTSNSLTVTSLANLGNVSNITITGGSNGQVLTTDGSGVLSFTVPVAGFGNLVAPMPTYIASADSFLVSTNSQGLFGVPITIDGELVIDGVLVDVSGSSSSGGNGTPGGANTQIQYNDSGAFGGNSTLTFNSATGILSTPSMSVTGNIIPTSNLTYSLGNNTNRFNNLYLSGNTLVLGGATISANATAMVFTNPAGGNFIIAGTQDTNTSSLLNGNSNIVISANGNINMAVAGNANLLRLSGTGFYSNSTLIQFKSPLINQGGNPNGSQLTSDDGKDRGSLLNYYTTFPATAFVGWDNSNGEFVLASEVTVSNDIVTVQNLGNVRASYFIGNVTGNVSGNFIVPGSNTQVLFNDGGIANGAAGLTYNKTNNLVSVSNAFTASGNITGSNIATGGDLSVLGNGEFGNLTSFGIFTTLSTITGGNFYSSGSVQTVGTGTFGDITTGGNIDSTGNIGGGNLATTGNLSVIGNASIAGNLLAVTSNFANFSGNVLVGGISNGTFLYPNGYARVRGLEVYNSGSNALGNITSRLITTTWANVSNLTVSANTDIQSLTATTGNFSGNIKSLNANLGNLVTANFFSGDGHLISNLTIAAGSAIENGNSNVSVAPNANVTISAANVANVVIVTGTNTIFDSNITANNNVIVSGSVYTNAIKQGVASITLDGNTGNWVAFNPAGLGNTVVIQTTGMNVTGYANISGSGQVGGNLNVGNNLTVTGNATVGNISSNIVSAFTANITGNITSGNITGGNLITANFFSGDGHLISNLTIAAGSAITNGNSNVSVAPNANVTISAAGNANIITVTGNSVDITKTTTVSNLIVSANANIANVLTVNTVSANTVIVENAFNVNSSVTSSGTLSAKGLVISADTGNGNNYTGSGSFAGNLSVGQNLSTSQNLVVSGTANIGTVNVSGTMRANGTASANYITATITTTTANLVVTDTANIATTNITTLNAGVANITGNLRANNINGGNLVTANFFTGDGYLLSNLTISAGTTLISGNSNVVVTTNGNVTTSVGGIANAFVVTNTGANVIGTLRATGNANVANLGAGVGAFTGNVSTANLNVTGTITASGNVTANGTLVVTGTANTGAIVSTGNITAINANLGNLVEANFFSGDGYLLTNLTIPAGTAIVNGNSNVLVTYSGDVNITSAGVANVLKVANTGVIVTGNLNTTGTVNGSSFANGNSNIAIANNGAVVISAEGNIQVVRITGSSANVYGNFFALSGATISGNATMGNANVSGMIDVAGNITGGNLNTGGKLTVGGNANVGNLGTTGFVLAVGNITGGSLNTTGTATVGTLSVTTGGAGITGDINATGNFNLTGNMNVTGNLNYSNVTNLVVGDPLIFIGANNPGDSYDLGIVASYVDTSIQKHTGVARNHTTGVWTFYSNLITEPTTVIDWANAQYPSVQVGNLIATANANIAGNITANYFLGNIVGNITGNISAPGANTQVSFNDGNILNATSGLTFNKSTNTLTVTGGANLGNLATANYVAGVLTTAAQPNITSTGTLTSLDVSGTVTAANITANTGVFTGNGSGLNSIAGANVTGNVGNALNAYAVAGANVTGNVGNALNAYAVAGANVSGQVANALVAGTVYTNAQPNITSVGTLTGLTVSGDILPSANITYNLGSPTQKFKDIYLSGNSIILGSQTISSTAGGVDLTGTLSGNGSGLSSITGANVSGQVANALVAGTVYTNAQPNITSTGTLTSLDVTGNISAGNINGGNLLTANYSSAVLTTAAQPNVTSVGTLTGLVSTGTVNLTGASNVSLGPVGNVKVTGGTSGQVIQTDGTGNLSFVSISSSSISNGNSNVNIPAANGNVNISAVGNANVVVVSGTGVNVVGTLNTTGNLTIGAASGGNITGANVISSNTGNFSANVTAAYFLGNGSQLTGILTGGISNGNSNVNIATANGNVTIAAVGNTTLTITGTGVNVSGTLNTGSGIITTTGNIIGGNIIGIIAAGSNAITTTGNITGGNLLGVHANGNSNVNIATANGNVTIAAAGNTTMTITGTGANISGYANVTGNISAGNINAGNLLTANYSTAVLTTAAQPNITSTGTLTSLNVSGTSNLGSVSNVTITGGTANYVLKTDGSGVLSWTEMPSSATVTVDNFTGNGVQTAFILSTTPASINQTSVNYNGATVLRSDYTLLGSTITFSSAPANGSLLEITTTNLTTGGGGGGTSAAAAVGYSLIFGG